MGGLLPLFAWRSQEHSTVPWDNVSAGSCVKNNCPGLLVYSGSQYFRLVVLLNIDRPYHISSHSTGQFYHNLTVQVFLCKCYNVRQF